MGVNKAIIVGNLGSDPELRHTNSGTSVCNFSVATNRKYKDGSGEYQEETEWHRIVVFGKTADNCSRYLSKGRQVYVEGRLQTREWTDKQGNTRKSTEIVAFKVDFLRSQGDGGGGSKHRNSNTRSNTSRSNPYGGSGSGLDDDIPF